MRVMKFPFYLIILCCIFFNLTSCSDSLVELILVNESEDTIHQVTISVTDQLLKFDGIAPDDVVTNSYKIGGDSHYVVDVEFESGGKLHKELGYVTRGFNYKHKLVVTNNDIKMIENILNK